VIRDLEGEKGGGVWGEPFALQTRLIGQIKANKIRPLLVADRTGYIDWDVILDRRKENGIPGELSKYDEGVREQ
jgi:hypothetical protein